MGKRLNNVLLLPLLLLLPVFLRATDSYEDLDEGSFCENDGSPGICKNVRSCPVAIESLKRHRSHHLKRCIFHDFDEIVCCPSTKERGTDVDVAAPDYFTDRPTKRPVTIKRRFQEACDRIQNEAGSNIIFLITDGEDALDKEFPHMAALGYETDSDSAVQDWSAGLDWSCGASIISEKFLLTAAHCVARSKPVKARVGVTLLNDTNPVDIDIRTIRSYENYDPMDKQGDIALVELASNINFNNRTKPACLYSENKDPLGLIVTGWGKTSINSEDDRSVVLQKAKLVPVPRAQCNATYFKTSLGLKSIRDTQICAWGNRSDACWGDSGGPLQIKEKSGAYSIVGVVSYGSGCGGKIPGVYTRISKYIDWIEDIVWPY
ncbi:unnamed protein product [Phyllotreta striolata]|uniref:Peptidase S1 domain-containing protein n=1 Tax=Phyllotreta striolata TaxID=444603 RepID=A0A9P0GXU9_PHYSR|nr:unnamed protein product [Phyllotreta striolata]